MRGQTPRPTKGYRRGIGGQSGAVCPARRLRLVEWIDEVVPKHQQGLSVGTDILLAVINRVLASCSQAQWVDWYHSTARYHDVPVRDQGPDQPAVLGPYELPSLPNRFVRQKPP